MKKIKSPLSFSKKEIRYSYCTCNFYAGCNNACEYCCMKRISNNLWKTSPRLLFRNENQAFESFKKNIDQNINNLKKYGIFFSLTTDPLLEDTKELTYKACKYCIEKDIPFKLLTKCTKWKNDDFIKNFPKDKKHLAHFGFSLTGKDKFEVGAPKNKERIKLLKELYNQGFKTWISAEPIIDIKSTIKVLKKSINHTYMIRFELLTPAIYKSNGLSTEYKLEDLVNIYNWIAKYNNILIYLGEWFIRKSGINREDLPDNFTKTGDLIIELKNEGIYQEV